MKIFLTIVLFALMLGTVGVLFAGLIGLTSANANPHRSNRLMRWRVLLQAAALLIFALLMLVLRS